MALHEMLPNEIWWLVCQELTARQDFHSIFMFALVNHSAAHVALPLLYSIHEQASASADASAGGKRKLAALWRAIILSSIDKTYFPYCLWIKHLKLGNLLELLTDIAPYPALRAAFFKDDMAMFNIVDDATKLTRQNRPRLNTEAIITKVGETLTAFVRDAAERENKSVALASLEGVYIPMDVLPVWLSRLSTLQSLSIRDGSVLGPPVALAIRDHCPAFRELECYYCDSAAVDEDLAGFFQTLPANSLEAFSVMSLNRLGATTLTALGHHSKSLKTLGLALQSTSFESLHLLSPCTALESLKLEALPPANIHWEAEYKDSFLMVASWLSECLSLKRLRLTLVPDAAKLLGHVLKAPNLRLEELDVYLRDDSTTFYSSLATQSSLKSLSLRRADEELPDLPATHLAQLVRAILECRSLKTLDIMQAMLSLGDIIDISRTLVAIEEFSFDGEDLRDDIFDPLFEMRNLKMLNINALSSFTFDGILGFIGRLATYNEGHKGFGLFIMRQAGINKLSPDEEEVLSQGIASAVGGRFEILYYGDPDEEHESDFSD